jgi:SAM-dependent methyltransferase
MCNVAVIEFFIENVERREFEGKRVLEVGSKYINGSVRPLIERFCSPHEYIGVDVEPERFVDLILPAEKLVEYFGPESFDVVIATELLEHVQDWRLVTINLKEVLKRGGYIYVTTRSRGFPFHAYPYDFWRYEIEDMRKIFSDFEILKLIKDHEAHGVLLKARKPLTTVKNNLLDIALYSMVLGQRTVSIPKLQEMPLSRKVKLLAFKIIHFTHGMTNKLLRTIMD